MKDLSTIREENYLQNEICLVICYIGKTPPGIEVFFKSCKKNPTIQFLIFTDQRWANIAPANVTIVRTTLESLRKLATTKLGFPVTLDHPYKLCDFKPAYGDMFAEYLASYKFWGVTDLDVIFGDIRRFITDEVLENYDVITSRQDFLTGHFTLYRNRDYTRSFYRHSRDYKRIFQTDSCLSFAECGRQWSNFRNGEGTGDEDALIDSATHVANRLARQKKIKSQVPAPGT